MAVSSSDWLEGVRLTRQRLGDLRLLIGNEVSEMVRGIVDGSDLGEGRTRRGEYVRLWESLCLRVEGHLQRLLSTAASPWEALVRVRGAQSACFRYGLVLTHSISAASLHGDCLLGCGLSEEAVTRLQRLTSPHLGAAAALSLLTSAHPAALGGLTMASVSAGDASLRLGGIEHTIPEYARSLIRAQRLDREERGAFRPSDPFFCKSHSRVGEATIARWLQLVSRRTGVRMTKGPQSPTVGWMTQRGLTLSLLSVEVYPQMPSLAATPLGHMPPSPRRATRKPTTPTGAINGKLLRERRLAQGRSVVQVADQIGTSAEVVWAIEEGAPAVTGLPLGLLLDLAEALDLQPADLFSSPNRKPARAKPDDVKVEAALARHGEALSRDDLATALGWSLNRTLDALHALDRRLAGSGTRLRRITWDRYALQPHLDALTEEQWRALATVRSAATFQVTTDAARVLHELAYAGRRLLADDWNSENGLTGVQQLLDLDLVELDGQHLVTGSDVRYSLLGERVDGLEN